MSPSICMLRAIRSGADFQLAIQAPAQPPPPHPNDRPLLRPLSTLGKPKVADPSVSFLRRTEYISSVASKVRPDSGPLRGLNPAPRRPLKRPSPEPDKDSPAYIKRKIDQSFAIAAANLKDKSRVKHPSKRNVKVVDAFPMLPDLDTFRTRAPMSPSSSPTTLYHLQRRMTSACLKVFSDPSTRPMQRQRRLRQRFRLTNGIPKACPSPPTR